MVNNNTDVVISRISFSYYNIIQYMSIIYLLTIWIQIVAYIVLLQLFLLIFPTFFATSIIKWQHDNQISFTCFITTKLQYQKMGGGLVRIQGWKK